MRISGAFAVSSVLIFAAAARALPLELDVDMVHSTYASTAGLGEAWNFSSNLKQAFSSQVSSFTIRDGLGTTLVTKLANDNSTNHGNESRPTFATLKNVITASPWTLDVVTDAGASHYSLSIGMNGVSEAGLAKATFLAPAPTDLVSAKPTFRWVYSGYVPTAYFFPDGFASTATLVPNSGEQSFTPTSPLAVGPHTALLQIVGIYNYQLPVTATLTSGVDQGPITAALNFQFYGSLAYTVPEPMLAIAMPAMIVCRRRRRA